MNATHSELLTRREAAAMLRVCVALLDKMRLPSVRLGRRVFYRKETLIACISANERPKEVHEGRTI
jgi:hypothetical protein